MGKIILILVSWVICEFSYSREIIPIKHDIIGVNGVFTWVAFKIYMSIINVEAIKIRRRWWIYHM
ncbi:hypothetical protein CK910_22985 [Aeromonas sp. CA23]|nr:hypothetical protein CK910_22985 [Aeromonas sp. CA23]